MTTLSGVYIALGLVTAAWISRIVATAKDQPMPAPGVAGWVFALVGTIVLVLAVFGIWVPR